jgi:hypothetical protein
VKNPAEELLEWSEFPPTVFPSYGATKTDNSRERGIRRARNIAAGGLARAKQFFLPVPEGSIGPLPPLPAPDSEAMRRMQAGLRASSDVVERAVGYGYGGDVTRLASLTVEYAKEAHREAQLLGTVSLQPFETWASTGQAPPSSPRPSVDVSRDAAVTAQFNLRPAVVRLRRLEDQELVGGRVGQYLCLLYSLLPDLSFPFVYLCPC